MSEHPIALTEPPEGYAEWLAGLKYMRVFAGTWTEEEIRQQPVGQLPWGNTSKHIRNVFREGGLDSHATVRDCRTVRQKSGQEQAATCRDSRQVLHGSLVQAERIGHAL